jgi:hypothetical protein
MVQPSPREVSKAPAIGWATPRDEWAPEGVDNSRRGVVVRMPVCSQYSSDPRDLTATLRRAAGRITADWRPI